MVLSIPISPEVEEKLKAKAAVAGVDVQTFVAITLERAALRPTLDEALAPLRAEFDDSGMSGDALVNLLESAKHEMRSRRSCGRDL
jgi:hypothetical protein